jgi:hypothetical protein
LIRRRLDFFSGVRAPGAIFYYMLFGRTPYKANNIFRLLEAIDSVRAPFWIVLLFCVCVCVYFVCLSLFFIIILMRFDCFLLLNWCD